jgi:hypothetical protein
MDFPPLWDKKQVTEQNYSNFSLLTPLVFVMKVQTPNQTFSYLLINESCDDTTHEMGYQGLN